MRQHQVELEIYEGNGGQLGTGGRAEMINDCRQKEGIDLKQVRVQR